MAKNNKNKRLPSDTSGNVPADDYWPDDEESEEQEEEIELQGDEAAKAIELKFNPELAAAEMETENPFISFQPPLYKTLTNPNATNSFNDDNQVVNRSKYRGVRPMAESSVLDTLQRSIKAQNLRRRTNRMSISRSMTANQIAGAATLHRRALRTAKATVRSIMAPHGKKYSKLSRSDRQIIDMQLNRPDVRRMVKQMTARVEPTIRSYERGGKPLTNKNLIRYQFDVHEAVESVLLDREYIEILPTLYVDDLVEAFGGVLEYQLTKPRQYSMIIEKLMDEDSDERIFLTNAAYETDLDESYLAERVDHWLFEWMINSRQRSFVTSPLEFAMHKVASEMARHQSDSLQETMISLVREGVKMTADVRQKVVPDPRNPGEVSIRTSHVQAVDVTKRSAHGGGKNKKNPVLDAKLSGGNSTDINTPDPNKVSSIGSLKKLFGAKKG